MRYCKGYVFLSDAVDLPLLLQIRDARAIHLQQLREFMILDGLTIHPSTLRWRVARLDRVGVIRSFPNQRYLGSPVFGITHSGLAFLESRGHCLLSLTSTAKHILRPEEVLHAIELVNIRLALKKGGILRAWKSDLEIASRNQVLQALATKNFDAVAEIEVDGRPCRCAIEYERSRKSTDCYRAIREVLDRDESVDSVLYLTSNEEMLYLLAIEMRGTRKRMGFALSQSFRQLLLETPTLTNGPNSEVVLFRDLLGA